MRIPDDEIIARLRNGERQLYRHLVERYKDRGFSLALRILSNREDAEEALQDAFVRAYKGLERFEGASSFGTWFYRILYNTCLTMLSRRKKNNSLEDMEDSGIPVSSISDGSTSGLPELEIRDIMEKVGEALSRIPEKYSSIITMFYLQELSYSEIAEVMEMPVGTVKTQLFRARALLQKEVEKEVMEKVNP